MQINRLTWNQPAYYMQSNNYLATGNATWNARDFYLHKRWTTDVDCNTVGFFIFCWLEFTTKDFTTIFRHAYLLYRMLVGLWKILEMHCDKLEKVSLLYAGLQLVHWVESGQVRPEPLERKVCCSGREEDCEPERKYPASNSRFTASGSFFGRWSSSSFSPI